MANQNSLSIEKYVEELKRSGKRIVNGASNDFWVEYEWRALMRMPSFYVELPAPGEVARVLRESRMAVVTYLVPPVDTHKGNAWLYICTDENYSLDKLSSVMRRNVRRGLKELDVGPIAAEQLLSHGSEAFCDTRKRVGLSDGTFGHFQQRFLQRTKNPAHVFWGAWKNRKLAAFLSITEVDRWVEIEGCFSVNSMLSFRPNDTLFYCALSHYLTQKKVQMVSYGLSSIQEASNSETLHAFKVKVGFEARLVHRVFELHPVLRPFQNVIALNLGRVLLTLAPGSPLLKKAVGVLANVLNERRTA